MRPSSPATPYSSPSGAAASPANPQRWLVLFAVGTGTFMSALDTSIVNTVLPVIQENFRVGIDHVEWVVTVYLLVVSGLLLSFGRLGDLLGHKRVYLGGFLVFVLSSVLCAFATSLPMLVLFRALQAFGAAMLAANSPAILTKNFPKQERGKALGLQATMTYLGLTIAPSLGGWLTHSLSWHWVFLVNLPVGAAAMLLSWKYIPADPREKAKERFDLAGALLFLGGLTSLLFALNQAHAWGWTSLPILTAFILALILLAFFLRVELHSPAPMLDLSLFKKQAFSTSVAVAVMNYIAIFAILFLMPFYLLQGRGFSTAQTGLILTAQPVVMAIVAPLSGSLSDKFGHRWLSVLGLALLALGLYLLSGLSAQTPLVWVAAALAVCGLGTGIFISPNNSALMGSAPANQQGIASGVLATARSFGMVLGVGFAGAIFTTDLARFGGYAAGSGTGIIQAVQASFLFTAVVAAAGAALAAARSS